MNEFQDKSGHRARLRSRFLTGGLSALAEYEIVELLLMFAIPRKDVKPLAKLLIAKFKNLKGILSADFNELSATEGMGEASACLMKFMRELIPLYHLQTLEKATLGLDTIDKLTEFFRTRLESEDIEIVELVCLDSELRLINKGLIRISEGSANIAKVDVRKIIENALYLGASSIVLAHNHPQGDARPSLDDIYLTKKISNACRPINLMFIEHIIVAKDMNFSFRRDGRMDDLYDITIPEESDENDSQVASPRKYLKAK